MATFNIYGTCICRDLFSFTDNSSHEVLKFLQSSSPLVQFIYKDKPLKKLTLSDFEDVKHVNNFKKKCIINDYNKTVCDYYTEKSDYFILDLVSFVNTNLYKYVQNDTYEHIFTASSWFDLAYNNGLKKYFSGGGKLLQLNRLELINEDIINLVLDEVITWVTDKLGYNQKNVIVIENKRASFYSDGEILRFFDCGTRKQVNGLLDKIYLKLKEKCPHMHFIKMPEFVYSDVNHIWGLTELHFCREYYDYLYKCVDSITKYAGYELELKLEELYKRYSMMLKEQVMRYITNNYNLSNGENLLKPFIPKSWENSYFVDKGEEYFDKKGKIIGKTEKIIAVDELNIPKAEISIENNEFYVDFSNIKRGVVGKNIILSNGWLTVNNSSSVELKDNSIIIRHCGDSSKAQTQVIYVVNNIAEFCDKWLTFSTWGRVIQKSNYNGIGGTVAVINSNNYNDGIFWQKKYLKNLEWEKISITFKVTKEIADKGITLCLRANTGVGDCPRHGIVEFANTKLEEGVFSTL